MSHNNWFYTRLLCTPHSTTRSFVSHRSTRMYRTFSHFLVKWKTGIFARKESAVHAISWRSRLSANTITMNLLSDRKQRHVRHGNPLIYLYRDVALVLKKKLFYYKAKLTLIKSELINFKNLINGKSICVRTRDTKSIPAICEMYRVNLV